MSPILISTFDSKKYAVEKFEINDILSKSESRHQTPTICFQNPDTSLAYIYEYELSNRSKHLTWYLVSHNYTIDDVEVYVLSPNQIISHERKVSNEYLHESRIRHKQPVFKINIHKGQNLRVIIKIKNKYSFKYSFELFSSDDFASNFFFEYQWFGIFYGMLLFVILYSLLVYFSIYDSSQLFYVVFILAQIFFMLFRDGTIVFLYSGQGSHSIFLKNISLAVFSISFICFTLRFYKVQKSIWRTVLLGTIAVRAMALIYYYDDFSLSVYHFDFIIFTVCLLFSIKETRKDFHNSKHFIAGLLCLWPTFSIYYLSVIGWTNFGGFSFFALYYGIVGEVIFFTLANAMIIRKMKIEKKKSKELNVYLEGEVAKRTATIIHQNQILIKQSNEFNEFLYRSSHDLIAPAKLIEGLCNLYANPKDPDTKILFDQIQLQLKFFNKLVKSLQNIYYSKSTLAEKKKVQLGEFVHHLTDYVKTYAMGMPIKIEVRSLSKNSFIETNIEELRMVCAELIDNASKFIDVNKADHIFLIRILEEEKNLVISFMDNGLGMENNVKERAFEVFYRGRNSKEGGSGLGLYLVKSIVEKYSGSIVLHTQKEHFTDVEIRFPLI